MLTAYDLGADQLAPITGGGGSGISVLQPAPDLAKVLASQRAPYAAVAPDAENGAQPVTLPAPKPPAPVWYKNWKIMVPVGVGGAVAVGLLFWLLKGKG